MSSGYATYPLPGQPETFNVGTYLSHRLQEIGIKDYFLVPGDFNLILMDQVLLNKHLRMINMTNELNAGYAADGYARAKGVAVVFITYSVGGLSLLNAISGAYADNLPVIVISGGLHTNDYQASNGVTHHTTYQRTKLQPLRMFEQCTARATLIDNQDTAADLITDTIQCAVRQKKPVYIEIASNLAKVKVPSPSPMSILDHFVPRTDVHLMQLSQKLFSKQWESAKVPVIIIGSRCAAFKGVSAAVQFAEKAKCAVVAQPGSKGTFFEGHEQYAGVYWGGVSTLDAESVVNNADLVVAIGCTWDESSSYGYSIPLAKGAVNVLSIDEERGLQNSDGQRLEVLALSQTLESLTEVVGAKPVPNAKKQLEERISKRLKITDEPSSSQLTIAQVTARLQGFVKGNHAVICDTGDSWFTGVQLNLPEGASFEAQFGYASIGWSLPASFGYSLAAAVDQRRVINIIGDGAAHMTIQTLSDVIRFKANPIIILVNNFGYQIEEVLHPGAYNFIANWSYHLLPDAFTSTEDASSKIPSSLVTTEEQFVRALQQANQVTDRAVFIEVRTRPDDVSEQLKKFGKSMGQWSQRASASALREGCALSVFKA